MTFNKRTMTFFRQLARHNEKAWFEAHRDVYENDARAPMRELIEELDVRFAAFAPEIVGDTKRSMFRINRDIRFSKDKSRGAIADDPMNFEAMLRSIPRRFDGLDDEAVLKRMPRGFAEDHPAAKWLRYQSFTTGRGLTDAEVTRDSLATLLANEYETLLPLVRWLNGALGFRAAARR